MCVAHSAPSLMGQGYGVAVVTDATIITAADQEIGLMRIRDAGGVLCPVKSVYHEWCRGVSRYWMRTPIWKQASYARASFSDCMDRLRNGRMY